MYILFEGVDTCGKSTQIEILKNEYKNAIFTKEPGATVLGKKIRDMILHQGLNSKRAEMFLFLADRAEHFKEIIKPNIDKIVISDRGFISGIAYHLANGNEDELDFLIKLNLYALENHLPDKIIFFKTDIDLIKERLESKNEDKIEQRGIEYLIKVQDMMEKVIKKLQIDFIVIDSSKTIDEINKIIKGYIFHD